MKIKKYFLLALAILLLPFTVYGLEETDYVNNWNSPKAYVDNLSNELLEKIILHYNTTPFKDGFVSGIVDAEQFYKTGEIKSTLIYNNFKTLEQKEFEIPNLLSLDLTSSNDNVFALGVDFSYGYFYIAKFDQELNLINNIQLEGELEKDLLFELKLFNKSIFKVYNDKLYLIINTEQVIEYDLNLNQLRTIEIESNFEEINTIFKDLMINFYESDTEKFYSYDKKEKYEVYGGNYKNNNGTIEEPFIRLYNNNQLIFEKKFDSITAYIKTVKIMEDYIIVFLGNDGFLNFVFTIDFEGNLKNIIQDSIISFKMSSNKNSVLITTINLEKECPEYLGEISECVAVYHKEYTLTKANKEQSTVYYGGSSSDYFQDAIRTTDGGYVTVGYTNSNDIPNLTYKGSSDAIIVKYDKNKKVVWEKSWGGTRTEQFYAIKELPNGNFIALGYSTSENIEGLTNSGNYDGIFVIYDKNGKVLHQQMWGGAEYDQFYDVLVNKDGSFTILASTSSPEISGLEPNDQYYNRTNAVLLNYNSSYEFQSKYVYTETYSSQFKKIKPTPDGGFAMVGEVYVKVDENNSSYYSTNPNNGSIVKFDKEYNVEWSKTYFTDDHYYYYPIARYNDFIIDKDGNYVVTGVYGRDVDTHEGIIVKYDQNGNAVWQKKEVGISILSYPEYTSIIEVEDGYIIGGNDSSIGECITMSHYDYNGNLNWKQNEFIDSSIKNNVVVSKIFELSKNKFIIFGSLRYDDLFEVNSSYDENGLIYEFSYQSNVIIKDTANGTNTLKRQGDITEIIPKPNEGYEVDQIIIKDVDGNIIDYYVQNNKYYFKTNKDVNVLVTYKEKEKTLLEDIINPETGAFISVIVLLILATISFYIYNYTNKYKPIIKI